MEALTTPRKGEGVSTFCRQYRFIAADVVCCFAGFLLLCRLRFCFAGITPFQAGNAGGGRRRSRRP